MNNLITYKDSLPFVSSSILADNTAIEHKAVIQLINTYLDDFNEFGGVTFQMEPFATAGGQQTRRIALLNEDHATLLMTYMRNSEVVRGFKKRLVHAFKDIKEERGFQLPQTMAQALQLAADQAVKIEQMEEQRALDAPKLEFVDKYMDSTGLRGLREAAKSLGYGPKAFSELLKKDKFVYYLGNSLTASQKFLDKGLFQLVEGSSGHNGHNYNQLKITPEGMMYFAERYQSELTE